MIWSLTNSFSELSSWIQGIFIFRHNLWLCWQNCKSWYQNGFGKAGELQISLPTVLPTRTTLPQCSFAQQWLLPVVQWSGQHWGLWWLLYPQQKRWVKTVQVWMQNMCYKSHLAGCFFDKKEQQFSFLHPKRVCGVVSISGAMMITFSTLGSQRIYKGFMWANLEKTKIAEEHFCSQVYLLHFLSECKMNGCTFLQYEVCNIIESYSAPKPVSLDECCLFCEDTFGTECEMIMWHDDGTCMTGKAEDQTYILKHANIPETVAVHLAFRARYIVSEDDVCNGRLQFFPIHSNCSLNIFFDVWTH